MRYLAFLLFLPTCLFCNEFVFTDAGLMDEMIRTLKEDNCNIVNIKLWRHIAPPYCYVIEVDTTKRYLLKILNQQPNNDNNEPDDHRPILDKKEILKELIKFTDENEFLETR